jgi:anti-sigma regulatory factor (Ser/Thr protein kinase)
MSLSSDLHITIRDGADVVAARHEARYLGYYLGFDDRTLTAIVAAISEVVHDLMAQGAQTELDLNIVMGKHRFGLRVVAHGQTLSSGGEDWALGLRGARHLMDEFKITLLRGGVTVTMIKWFSP